MIVKRSEKRRAAARIAARILALTLPALAATSGTAGLTRAAGALGARGGAATAGALPAPATGQAREPFAPPDWPAQYPSDRAYHLRHLRLELAFDLHRQSASGTATNTVVPLAAGLDHLVFHAAGLEVSRVRLAGEAGDLAFAADPAAQTLTVRLPHAYGPQDELAVAIDYAVVRPRAGLFFSGPSAAYPDHPWQLFSDGEPQLNRFWYPSWDEPDDKATTELVATVAKPLEVIGNGRLVAVTDRGDGRRTFDWLMEQPHSTYLTSVVIGEFSAQHTSWNGVSIDTYVPPALAGRVQHNFGRTGEMMEYLSRVTGVPYPYAKYSQAAVYGFMWGGMENISASTETADAVRDTRTELDTTSDDLVLHELAHQWFGDLVTCRSWAQAWLNEGMATYFEALYRQQRAGGTAGDDELAWRLDTSRQNYFLEDRERYRRPLVTARYVDPVRMFDAHSYDKGALVMHMIHDLTGDAGWWQGIRTYLHRHALGTVNSRDLETAFEDAAGTNLEALFQQFVHGAGYPEIKVRWEHQAAAGVVRLEVRQTQELDGETGLFSYPVEVALVGGSGSVETVRVPLLARPLQDLIVRTAVRPRTVVFDPHGTLLKSLDFDKPAAEWIEQLEAPLPLPAHLDAVRALAQLGGDQAVAALGKVLLHHRASGARQVAAAGLRQIGGAAALAALVQGAHDPDARVRAAVHGAFGGFPDHPELIARLRHALEGDESYGVRAAAATALGNFHDQRTTVAPILVRALDQRSFVEEVERSAIQALADLGAPETWAQAQRLARYGSPPGGRGDAMDALARYAAQAGDAAQKREARRILEGYLDDPEFNVREKVPDALADLGDPAAIPALQRSLQAEVQDDQRHPREDAIHHLQQSAAKPAAGQSLEERVRQLERANEVLQEQLRQLQQPPGGGEKPGGATPAAAEKPGATAEKPGAAKPPR